MSNRSRASYSTKQATAPSSVVAAAEASEAQAGLPAGGHGRWKNGRPRGIPQGTKIGPVEVRFWPPQGELSLPNECEGDARDLGLAYLGPVQP